MPPSADPGQIALRVTPMPRDTNAYGTVFGGVILSYVDQASAVEAIGHGAHRWVTASIERVDFRAPVRVGDIVTFYTRTTRTGTKSVTVAVTVLADRCRPTSDHPNLNNDTRSTGILVTEATVTMVAVDANGKAIPFRSPPTIDDAAI